MSLDGKKNDDEEETEKTVTFSDTIKEYCIPSEEHRKYISPQPDSNSLLFNDWKKGVKTFFEKNGMKKDKIKITDDLK